MVSWDIAWREDPAIAAYLLNRAWLIERIKKGRKQTLILGADNGKAMRAEMLGSRLGELGVLRSFTRARVSNGTPCSEFLTTPWLYWPQRLGSACAALTSGLLGTA